MIAGIEVASTAHTTHHFIEYQQHPVLITNISNSSVITLNGGNGSHCRSDNGFGYECRD